MQLVIIIAIGVISAVVGIMKIIHNHHSFDEYEMDFEERHKGDFVNRFE